MTAQTTVPCLNPKSCGVKSHIAGSAAHKECISKVVRGEMTHNPTSIPPPPNPLEEGLSSDAVERINECGATKEDLDNLQAAFSEELSGRSFSLYFVDRDESLREEDIEHYLQGEYEDLQEDVLFNSGRSFQMRDEAEEEAKKLLDWELGVDFEALPDEVQEDLINMIEEKDDSDVLADLVRNTPAQLMRYQVSPIKGDIESAAGRSLYVKHPDVSHKEIVEDRANLLEKGMIDSGFIDSPLTEKEKDRLREAIENGPEYFHEGVSLDAIWNGSISDVNLPGEWERPQGRTPDDVLRTVGNDEGIYMVLIDTWNGSGFDFYLDRPITMKLSQSRSVHTDREAPGYGWDSIAGVYADGFNTGLKDKRR